MTRFLLSLAGMALMWTGSHVMARYTPRSVYDKELAAQKKAFMVHGGRSLRTFQLLGKYDSAQEAIRAADKFRADGLIQVEVSTGHDQNTIHMEDCVMSYSVYRNPCKGYVEHAKTDSLKKAQEMAGQFKKDGEAVEIVYHRAMKAAAAEKEFFWVRGGRSLRSVDRLGKYASADEAIRAAEKFRADGLVHVAVVHGTEGPAMWGENWAESFVVYRKQGRVYTEYGKTDSLTMAQGMAERIKLSGNEFEIVYYFPAK